MKKNRAYFLIGILYSLFFAEVTQCLLDEIDPFDIYAFFSAQPILREIDFFKTKLASITVLKDVGVSKEKFIVKQSNAHLFHKHIVLEVLGSMMAKKAGIPANDVVIIPIGYEFAGKRLVHVPATLHTYVPGVHVNFLPDKLHHLVVSIHQRVGDDTPEEKRGLTRDMIHDMSVREDLCKMVALDTFMANTDRNKKNYFYDSKSDMYYAIDFGCSYRVDLACYACRTVESMIKNKGIPVSVQELKGLKVYGDTLKFLMECYPLHWLQEKFMALYLDEGIKPDVSESRLFKKLKLYKESIRSNYRSCEKLVVLIDKLLAKHEYIVMQ